MRNFFPIDQGDVLSKLKAKGIAVGIEKESINADEIHSALETVLQNSSFKENVKNLSNLVRDVEKSGLDRAVFLLEYLMRHDGAAHLKLSSRNLNFLQYYSLDIFIVIALVFYVSRKMLWFVFCKCKTTRPPSKVQKLD